MSADEAERVIQNAARIAQENASAGTAKMVFKTPRGFTTIDPSDPDFQAKQASFIAQREERARQAKEAAAAQIRSERIRDARRRAGVPPRYDLADLSTAETGITALDAEPGDVAAYRDAVATLRNLSTNPGMLALVGIRGGGKTFLACGLVNLFCSRGQPAVYRRVSDIFLDIKDSFANGSRTQREIVKDYARPDLLVLDEMQVRSDTAWENVVLTDLIDRRYADFKSTVFIANLRPAEFAARIGESVVSRIAETGGVVECTWPSFRTGAA